MPTREPIPVAVATDVGRLRRRNEDHAVVADRVVGGERDRAVTAVPPPLLVAVADGLGGHPGGDVASRVVADRLAAAEVPTSQQAVADLFDELQAAVHDRMEQDAALRGMGSTLVTVVVTPDGQALVGNAGDSPAFIVGDRLTEVTVADRDPFGAITQCLGGGLAPQGIDPHVELLDGHGRLLLCSDGLSDVVAGAEILRAADAGIEPGAAADRLVDLALEAGAPDNVTVAIVDLPAPRPDG